MGAVLDVRLTPGVRSLSSVVSVLHGRAAAIDSLEHSPRVEEATWCCCAMVRSRKRACVERLEG